MVRRKNKNRSNEPLGGEKLLRESVDIIRNEYYQQFAPHLERVLAISRQGKYANDPVKLYGLQEGFFEMLEPGERAVSGAGKLLAQQPDDGIFTQQKRNKYLNLAYKQVADGIAWRTLGYDRFNARILSQGHSPGPSWGKEGRTTELNMAYMIAKEYGDRVILNDTTHCMRVGDLVSVKEDGRVVLIECKSKKIITAHSIREKIRKGRALNKKQEPRLLAAQAMLDERIYRDGAREIPVEDITHTASDHMIEAECILKEASRDGYAGKHVAPYLYIEAIDLTVINKDSPSPTKNRFQSPPVFEWSNYDKLVLFDEGGVARSHVPYTVFPFEDSTIVKIIMGTIMVRAYVLEQPLIAEFKKHGWNLTIDLAAETEAEIPIRQYKEYFSSPELFPKSIHKEPAAFMLEHPYDGFTVNIFGHIVTMLAEFTTVEYVASFVHELHCNAYHGSPNLTYPVSVSDRARWN